MLQAPKVLKDQFDMFDKEEIHNRLSKKLSDFSIISKQFDESIESDKPREISLEKLLSAASNNSIAYSNDISAMADKLCLMTVPSISNSIPWLTYLNTVLLILIIMYIAPYRKLQTVAAGVLLPSQVTAFIPNANYFISSTSFLLDVIFIIAFLIITAYIIWKWLKALKNIV